MTTNLWKLHCMVESSSVTSSYGLGRSCDATAERHLCQTPSVKYIVFATLQWCRHIAMVFGDLPLPIQAAEARLSWTSRRVRRVLQEA
ncbi:hypothetical protein M514_13742 [Trichuris suis]|uniref:Uncharacterized protein n=1 Tax=Trichuris suis TaxID=68888 RepID=A0A085NLU2_9BILA|nr:hypothetical protein M513_13742 [Trichuris suis]KFD70438.1 hypothetical protein M514_13742 [Trichuris suis]